MAKTDKWLKEPAESIPKGLTRGDFYKQYVKASVKWQVNIGAILMYICSAIVVIMGFWTEDLSWSTIVDALVPLLLGVALQSTKSWFFGVLSLIYIAGFSYLNYFMQIGSVNLGRFISVIAAIVALVGCFRFSRCRSAYNAAAFKAKVEEVKEDLNTKAESIKDSITQKVEQVKEAMTGEIEEKKAIAKADDENSDPTA